MTSATYRAQAPPRKAHRDDPGRVRRHQRGDRVMRSDVVAIYVDPRGPYPSLVAEWYDADRDARSYTGTLPVVAHPPCGPWGRLRHLSRHDRPEHALHAVEVVRRVGGVLEHPAHSLLWRAAGLPLPGELPDAWGGRTIAVCQSDWGHVARKRSWIYWVSRATPTPPPFPGREPTHWISGGRGRGRASGRGRSHTPVPTGIKVCSAQQRRRTPIAFAEWLIDLASP